MQFSIVTILLAATGFVAALPADTQPTPTTPTPTAAPSATCSPGPVVDYVVQANDTLTIVSQRLNSGICNIAQANNLANPNFIETGSTLKVPTYPCTIDNTSCLSKPSDNLPCVTGVPPTYTIVSGDTFFIVAQRLNLSTDALLAANPGVDPLLLEVGQVINIPICPS